MLGVPLREWSKKEGRKKQLGRETRLRTQGWGWGGCSNALLQLRGTPATQPEPRSCRSPAITLAPLPISTAVSKKLKGLSGSYPHTGLTSPALSLHLTDGRTGHHVVNLLIQDQSVSHALCVITF